MSTLETNPGGTITFNESSWTPATMPSADSASVLAIEVDTNPPSGLTKYSLMENTAEPPRSSAVIDQLRSLPGRNSAGSTTFETSTSTGWMASPPRPSTTTTAN